MNASASLNPHALVKHIAKIKGLHIEEMRLPEHLLLVHTKENSDFARVTAQLRKVDWWYRKRNPLYVGRAGSKELAVCLCPIGAPAAAMILEELVACGARKVLNVGLAAGIDPSLNTGEIFVVTRALCDEGTSSHYLEKPFEIEPSLEVNRELFRTLTKNRVAYRTGSIWTTDGYYRETSLSISRFLSLGASAVDMETSALFAVGKFRRVKVASAQVIREQIGHGWTPVADEKELSKRKKLLIEQAARALCEV